MIANIANIAMNDGDVSDLNYQVLNDSQSNYHSIIFNQDESMYDYN